MTEELDILKIIAENANISQRKISERTGISLGQVNFLIKKCARKGLIKIEGQTSKSIRYILTPKGFAEKAALTLQYIKISYGAVITLTDKIRETAGVQLSQNKKIIIYGPADEMMEICKLALGSQAEYIYDLKELDELGSGDACLYWTDQETMKLVIDDSLSKGKSIVWIDILR